MKAHELAGWTMFGFSWVGMESIAVRILAWLGVPHLPKDPLSPPWSWESLVLHVLTFFATAALIRYVLGGVEADAKKEKA
jgi:hypothetical protein